jgi:hypothetical protein
MEVGLLVGVTVESGICLWRAGCAVWHSSCRCCCVRIAVAIDRCRFFNVFFVWKIHNCIWTMNAACSAVVCTRSIHRTVKRSEPLPLCTRWISDLCRIPAPSCYISKAGLPCGLTSLRPGSALSNAWALSPQQRPSNPSHNRSRATNSMRCMHLRHHCTT